jgi:sugar phosphate isomerase/epimerase/HEAT repeat protein
MTRSLLRLVALFALLVSQGTRATESEETLLARLQSQAPMPEKWAIARQLAVTASPASVPKLAEILKQDTLSDLALCILEPMPDPAAGAALRHALPQAKGHLALALITSLGARHDAEAVDLLAPFLTNSDSTLTRTATAALGKIGGVKAATALENSVSQVPEELRMEILARIIECANQSVAQGNPSEAHAMFEWLANAKAPAGIHASAMRGLILTEDNGGAKRLPDELRTETTLAIRMLQTELPGEAISKLAAQSYNEQEPGRAVEIVQALGQRPDPEAAVQLEQIEKSTKLKEVRLAAIRSMGNSSSHVPVLAERIHDSDPDIAAAAREILAGIPGPEADQAVLGLFKPGADPSLAITLASRRCLKEATPKLLEIARASGSSTANITTSASASALAALGKLMTEKESTALMDLLTQTNLDLTALEGALVLLDSRTGHSDAFAGALAVKLDEVSPAAQSVVLRVLGENGCSRALSAVRSALSRKNAEVKQTALRVLTQWASAEEAPDLLELSKVTSDPANKRLCLQGGLRLIGNGELSAAERFELCLKARPLLSEPADKKLFLSALGGTGYPAAAEMIQPFLEDVATRPEAAVAILTVADQVLARTNHTGAARLKSPLVKVIAVSDNPDVVKRARDTAARLDAQPSSPAVHLADYPFFPFCIDWHDSLKRNFTEQAAMLKQLDYVGVGHIWLDNVAERLSSLDQAGLKLFQITMVVDVTPGKQPFDSKFKDVLAQVKGRHMQFDLIMNGMPPSDARVDAHAVEILNQMADLARDTDVQLLIYPHQGSWVERIEDAVRVADKVNRPNVGVMFNLCHWLRVDSRRDYRPILEKAMPRLWAVSISGADAQDPNPGWERYIQPLDCGNFEMGPFLKTLRQLGYKGPIGLQCYGIPGDVMEHLERSQNAWKQLSSYLNE